MAIKMTRETVERARELAAYLASNGWGSLSIERSDPATMMAVAEAAIDALYKKAFGKGRK